MSQNEESFFDKERDRLSREITSSFEELLSSTNGLNRKLEDVLGMSREYSTIAELWKTFHDMMRASGDAGASVDTSQVGLPGTGGHVPTGKHK
ncbi:DASH outer kinetochore protein [Fistulina hepatica ATCC 64428]|uniref:DASH complex subunit DAD1 n=1 Tax=Fistulina hepatica ATCC 64428 TaxID=1128425 RepID=A0A0D7A6Z6_9AGAR|nr:DASH outer kinetochore protein [Fistulina hepatica ATCC 64428]